MTITDSQRLCKCVINSSRKSIMHVYVECLYTICDKWRFSNYSDYYVSLYSAYHIIIEVSTYYKSFILSDIVMVLLLGCAWSDRYRVFEPNLFTFIAGISTVFVWEINGVSTTPKYYFLPLCRYMIVKGLIITFLNFWFIILTMFNT